MRVRHRVAFALGALCLATEPAAAASPPVRFVYVRQPSASACPDEAELREAVARRTGRDPFAASARQSMLASIDRDAAGYVSRVELVGSDGVSRGARVTRTSGEDCREVIDAVALAIAIALDSAEPDDAHAPVQAPSLASAPPSASPRPPPPAAPRSEERPPHAPAEPPGMQVVVALDALASAGTAPVPVACLGGALEGRVSRWSLAAELRLDAAGSASVPGGGRVEAQNTFGTLLPCWRWRSSFVCGAVSLGRLAASSIAVAQPRADATFYPLVGARMGVELPAFGLLLRAHGTLYAPLERVSLTVDGAPVWITPAVVATLGAGVALRFR